MKHSYKIFAYLLIVGLFAGMTGQYASSAAGKTALSKKKLILEEGDTAKLKVKNTKEKIKWSSTKKRIASVSKKGKVKALKAGKAVIIAKVGNKKHKCQIRVKKRNTEKPDLDTLKYKNNIFTKELYAKLVRIDAAITDKKIKITSIKDISAIYSLLASVELTEVDPGEPILSGAYILDLVTSDGKTMTVGVNKQIACGGKRYTPSSYIADKLHEVLEPYF